MNFLDVKALISFLILANVGLYGVTSQGAVWETHGRKWSDDAIKNPDGTLLKGYTWDDVCSDWIREKVDVDIFNTPKTPFKDVPDCGQVAALIHLECAIQFHLPYALHGKKEFSNNTTRFDSISDPDARIWAYKQFVAATSGADSIPADTYAVDISGSNVKPGTILLFLKGSPYNHTLTVKSVSPLGYITFINGTLLKGLQNASRRLFITEGIDSTATPFKAPFDGFRNWRHYDEQLGSYIPLEKGFNPTKEYGEEFKKFADNEGLPETMHTWQQAVQRGMETYEGDKADRIDELQTASCGLMINRTRVVLDGDDILQALKGRGINTGLNPITYDGFFTPQRDSNLTDRLTELENFLATLSDDNQQAAYIDYRNKYFDQCAVPYGRNPEQVINLIQFQEGLLSNKVSSNANDSLDKKWGMPQSQTAIVLNKN